MGKATCSYTSQSDLSFCMLVRVSKAENPKFDILLLERK